MNDKETANAILVKILSLHLEARRFIFHINTVHERQKDQKCEFCEESFSMPSTLKNHIKIIHALNKDQSCHICSKSFFIKNQLTQHIKRDHNRKNK